MRHPEEKVKVINDASFMEKQLPLSLKLAYQETLRK